MPVILHVLLCAAVSGDAAVETKPGDQWQSAKECLAALEASYRAQHTKCKSSRNRRCRSSAPRSNGSP